MGLQIRSGWGNRVCHVIVTLAVVATAAAALVVDRVDSLSLLALTLIGLYLGFRYGFGRGLAAGEKWLIWTAAAWFGLTVFGYVNGIETNLGFRILGRYLRFLLLIPAYLALRRLAPPRTLVWFGFVAGSLVAAGSALAQYFMSGGVERAAGDSLAITFGDLALLSGFIAAVMTPPLAGRWRYLARFGGVMGLAGGLIASMLSGTRGGWLAIPLLAALLIAAVTRGLGHRWRFGAFAVGVFVVAVVVAVPETGVQARLAEAVQGWRGYSQYRDGVAAVPHTGVCVSAPVVVRGLAHLAMKPNNGVAANITAVDDARALAAADFGTACAGGRALRVTNPSDRGWAWVAVSRIVNHADMPGFAGVLARGKGRVRISGIGEKSVDWPGYRKVLLVAPPRPYVHYFALSLGVPPGGELYVVPLELNPGAYRYFYTASSVGARLAMWGTAWDIFQRYPLTGAGTGAYRDSAEALVDAHRAAPITSIFDHPHNQYLNDMASRGVLGLIEILALLGVPAYLFAVRIRDPDPAVRQPAYAGLMTMCGFAVFGLTETIFNHSLTIDYYVIFVGAFAALMYRGLEVRG